MIVSVEFPGGFWNLGFRKREFLLDFFFVCFGEAEICVGSIEKKTWRTLITPFLLAMSPQALSS